MGIEIPQIQQIRSPHLRPGSRTPVGTAPRGIFSSINRLCAGSQFFLPPVALNRQPLSDGCLGYGTDGTNPLVFDNAIYSNYNRKQQLFLPVCATQK